MSKKKLRHHLTHPRAALSFFALAVFIFAGSIFHNFLLVNTDMFGAIYPRVLAELSNEDREEQNVQAMKISPELERVAQLKADDMASKGYFAHTSPEGLSPWYWFSAAGYEYEYAGENLAVNFSDSSDVENAWMNSPTHKANILNPRFTEIGIATAEGVYKGKKVVFVAQVFATPKKVAAVSVPEKTSEPIAVEENNNSQKEVVAGAYSSPGQEQVTPANNESLQQASTLDLVVTNPGKVMSISYAAIALMVGLSLLLLLFSEVAHHHVRAAVCSGAMLIFLVVFFTVYNEFLLGGLAIG